MKLIKILIDLAFIAILIGFVILVCGVGGTKEIIHGQPTGKVHFPINGLTIYMFSSCFVLVIASMICAWKSFYGIWPTSPSGPKVRIIYAVPFLSAIIAYLRLRSGQPWIPQEPRQPFPWEYAKRAKTQKTSSQKGESHSP